MLVRLSAPNAARYRDLAESFRATFPRHGQRTWRRDARCWSLPGREYRRLVQWLSQQRDVRVVCDAPVPEAAADDA